MVLQKLTWISGKYLTNTEKKKKKVYLETWIMGKYLTNTEKQKLYPCGFPEIPFIYYQRIVTSSFASGKISRKILYGF